MSLRSLAWMFLPRSIMMSYAERTILTFPDRVYMRTTLTPAILARRPQRLLNLGVHYYTYGMQQTFAQSGVQVFTADPDGRKARWGAAERHRVCKADEIEAFFPDIAFDCVILNGVLGYGIDTQREFDRTLQAIAHKLSAGGVLVLGWDENMFLDPLATGSYRGLFARDASLLGADRVHRLNGLRDTKGQEAMKCFDVLRRLDDAQRMTPTDA